MLKNILNFFRIMKPRFLWWVVLLLVQFGRPKHVEVGVEIGGTGHTFTAHVNELSGDTRARALEWCAAMNVDDPRCASFISDRVKFLQGLDKDNAQQQIQSIYAHIGAGLSVDSALVGQLRQLSEVLAGRGGDLEADANYLLSVSLRRLRPEKFGGQIMLDSRKALGRALDLTPYHEMPVWHHEFGDFIGTVEGLALVEDETAEKVSNATLRRIIQSLEMSTLGSVAPVTLADVVRAVEELVAAAQRLYFRGVRSNEDERKELVAAASACISSAGGIISHVQETSLLRQHESSQSELWRLRFFALRIELLIHPAKAAHGLREFIHAKGEKATPVELCWAAYAQLRSSYKSIDESKR